MDLREEQGSEGQAQPTVSTPAASQGNVGAGTTPSTFIDRFFQITKIDITQRILRVRSSNLNMIEARYSASSRMRRLV